MEKKETKLSRIIIGLLILCLITMVCLGVTIKLKQIGNSSTTEAPAKKIVLRPSHSPAKEEDEQFVIIDVEKSIGNFQLTVPQIDGDSDKINAINALILSKIENMLLPDEENGVIDYFTYKIQLLDSEILSVLFEFCYYNKTQPYPADRAFTLNVDLREEKELDTNNLIADQKALCQYIQSGEAEKDFVEGEKGNGAGKPYLFDKSYLKRCTISDISDNLEEADFYFTSEKIGIVYFVPHAVGDYFLLEIRNRDYLNENILERFMLPAKESDDIHEQYVRYLRELKEEWGFEACRYTFYDIDRNGIDELIYDNGYIATTICSYKDGEVVDLNYDKYGGNFKIYSDESVVFWSGGHMDNYYDDYFKIVGSKIKTVASKSWTVKHIDDTEVVEECVYKVKGKKVEEAEYKEFIDSLNEKNVVTNKQLKWEKL